RKSSSRNRRVASELNFGKAPGRVFAGYNDVTDQGQLCATAQAVPSHYRDAHFRSSRQTANRVVEFAQHGFDFVTSMRRDIHAGREVFACTGKNDGRNVVTYADLVESLGEFVHHLKVDDVLLAMGKHQACDGRLAEDFNSRA